MKQFQSVKNINYMSSYLACKLDLRASNLGSQKENEKR